MFFFNFTLDKLKKKGECVTFSGLYYYGYMLSFPLCNGYKLLSLLYYTYVFSFLLCYGYELSFIICYGHVFPCILCYVTHSPVSCVTQNRSLVYCNGH